MDSKSNDKKSVIVQTYKLWELAVIYRVSNYVMRNLIAKHKKQIGKREGHFYRTDQVAKIFELIKPPSDINIV